MHKVIFLDTNIFLHYQPFVQINWLEVVNAETVAIIVPPVIIRELNEHKDAHPRIQIRERAGNTIKKLSELFDSGAVGDVREGVSIRIEDRDPTIDFTTYQLNPSVKDDHLIASILFYKQERMSDHTVLITSDLGLALTSKAGRQGIHTQKMPVNLRIPREPDPSEVKLRQLENQIRELKSRIPNLSLVHKDTEQYATFKLPKPHSLERSKVELKVSELKAKYPKRSNTNEINETNISESLSKMATYMMDVIPEKEFERYNKDVEKYISDYIDYMSVSTDHENLKRRCITLQFALANTGTLPAEDIDIYMHFPDGFQLADELPEPPVPPRQPNEPMTELQKMGKMMNLSQAALLSSYSSAVHDVSPIVPANVSSPSIKRVNSYEVHVHIQKIKHGLPELLDPLFLTFADYETAGSFNVDFRILAANIPHEVTGALHIIIQKE